MTRKLTKAQAEAQVANQTIFGNYKYQQGLAEGKKLGAAEATATLTQQGRNAKVNLIQSYAHVFEAVARSAQLFMDEGGRLI